MDSLDINLHQELLLAIARNFSTSQVSGQNASVIHSDLGLPPVNLGPADTSSSQSQRDGGVFAILTNGIARPVAAAVGLGPQKAIRLTLAQANANIAFAEYASRARPGPAATDAAKKLIDIVSAIPTWEIDSGLGLQGTSEYPMPDQLAFAVVSALVELSTKDTSSRTSAAETLLQTFQVLRRQLDTADPARVITHIAPSVNGLRRALSSTPFQWTIENSLSDANSGAFLSTPSLDRLTKIFTASYESDRQVAGTLSRYVAVGRPLSSNFVIFTLLQCRRIMIGSAICADPVTAEAKVPSGFGLGSLTDPTWRSMTAEPIVTTTSASLAQQGLAAVFERALGIHHDTVEVLSDLEADESPSDPYILDILEESLKLATVSSLAAGTADDRLLVTLREHLSENAKFFEGSFQSVALESVTILMRNFPMLAEAMTTHIRKFITSPVHIFESQDGQKAPEALLSAGRAVAICMQIVGHDDFTNSTIYSLLNYLPNAIKEASGGALGVRGGRLASDSQSFKSAATRARSGPQKRQVAINTIYAVSQIAQIMKDEDISRLAISMLLQRLRGTDPLVEAAIMANLADLALLATPTEFGDIIKGFSQMNRATHAEENEFVQAAVLAAQTRLAQNLIKKPEFADAYLEELLELFVDKSVHIQSVAAQGTGDVSPLYQNVLALLPVIDALVSQDHFTPHIDPSSHTVAQFRNMWLLCTMFGFLSPQSKVTDWQRSALQSIAIKTPCLIRGTALNFVDHDLEYNSVLRKDYPGINLDSHREELSSLIPNVINQTRALTRAQAIFLLTIARLEALRASTGRPAMIVSYFHNPGINSSPLFPCLQATQTYVFRYFRKTFGEHVNSHATNPIIYSNLRELLIEATSHMDKLRNEAFLYISEIVESFPSLLCEFSVVVTMLEILTLLRHSCEGEYDDEYTPTYTFHSARADLTLEIPDDYKTRNDVLVAYQKNARSWLSRILAIAPTETQNVLQRYIDEFPESEKRSEMGRAVAIDLARSMPKNVKESALPEWGGWRADQSTVFAGTFARRHLFKGSTESSDAIRDELRKALQGANTRKGHLAAETARELFYKAASAIVHAEQPDFDLLHLIVAYPTHILTPQYVEPAAEAWSWIADERPDLEARLMTEIMTAWSWTCRRRRGFFSDALDAQNPMVEETEYTPTDKDKMTKNFKAAQRLLTPHGIILDFLSSRFHAFRYHNPFLVAAARRLVLRSTKAAKLWSTHPLARELRLKVLLFGFYILRGSKAEPAVEFNFRESLYNAAFSWFTGRPGWSYGSNRLQMEQDLRVLREFQRIIGSEEAPADYLVTASSSNGPNRPILPGRMTHRTAALRQKDRQLLLQLLVENEIGRVIIWLNPLNANNREKDSTPSIANAQNETSWRRVVRTAWFANGILAVRLPERFKQSVIAEEVRSFVRAHPERVYDSPEALQYLVGDSIQPQVKPSLRHLLYWAPVPPVTALKFFLPEYESDPSLLQYAMRTLEQHPVKLTFFYIPQVVQALRTDALGYVERFIFETAKISQTFCHQIIWNMKANCFKDDNAEEPDPMKPQYERLTDMIVASLSGEAKDFYEREFTFFGEVTSISKKLQPFIKKSKPEKKAKIDEEMAKIKVDPGVYLPSNPDGVVVDIDRKSGRPLQSHAKAPFMATFKVHRERGSSSEDEILEADQDGQEPGKGYDTWQAAIFKVGDDCRQDVLALQVIAMFKNMFTSFGLDLHVVPYRVTATAPGCGVIDVIPNATSRDEMGRAKVNDLFSFFVGKYGPPESTAFQKARMKFVQSMAAYSLLCYIIQIKDRHNGNIMIDGEGHITHIGPGGVKFEPNSFKLTHEMVTLMGGRNSPGFRLFSELTVKAFLACRPFAEEVVSTCELMIGTELPSFKGKPTIDRLRDRFKLGLSERQAAEYMQGLIDNAFENGRSIFYDYFQELQNGIPYAR